MEAETRNEAWRLNVSDNLWLLATEQRAQPERWRPFSELTAKDPTKEVRDSRTAEEIKADILAQLRQFAGKGG